MLKRIKVPIILNETDEENSWLANWIWDSHFWEEWAPGYFKCKWCEVACTAYTPIMPDAMLCRKNPAVKFLISEYVGEGAAKDGVQS